ncbi:homeobox-leucine zipper protein hat5 isoform x1 [Lasius niger]|uniref:Homeobox-leucine zipper protein hat5 isoform x1 n=1 Tax=Lasius niger TaxID=67767 RepID=A0A0J7KHH5_LASNI|nr:homeobox-leucine zipper protein hat5 isoform x1 [Lasius niger]
MRGKSSFQGKISGYMKARINKAKDIIRLLTARVVEKGDATFWQNKCERLTVQLKAEEKKMEFTKKNLDKINSAYDNLLEENDALGKERDGLEDRIVIVG